MMQIRMVDAVKVHQLKKRANRLAHQNVHDSRLIGITIHQVLTELELWEERGGVDDGTDTGHGSGEKTSR